MYQKHLNKYFNEKYELLKSDLYSLAHLFQNKKNPTAGKRLLFIYYF